MDITMHILMILSTPIPICEGIGSHVLGLAKRLKNRGYEITLMTRGNWQGVRKFVYEGFKVIKVPFYPLYPFHVHIHGLFVERVIEQLNLQPDIIHLHSPLVPSIAKKHAIVTTFHTPMLVDTSHVENIGLRSFLIKLMGKTTSYWIEKKLLSISDAIITVSQGVAEELKDYYGYEHNVFVVPNVIDTEHFKPTARSLEKGKLLYVGRLAYRKGLFEIINSAKNIVEQYPKVKYLIVGDGPFKKLLNRMVQEFGLNPHFEFFGEITDSSKIRNYYHEATAILIPSYYESGPITLLEAMACGKAIITTETGLAKGLIEDGQNALMIKPKSVDALTTATLKLLSSGDLCQRLGDAARRTIVEKIDIEKNTDQIEEAYRCAIERFKKSNKC